MNQKNFSNQSSVIVSVAFTDECPRNKELNITSQKIKEGIFSEFSEDIDLTDIKLHVQTSKKPKKFGFDEDISNVQQYDVIINTDEIGRVKASNIEGIIISELGELEYDIEDNNLEILNEMNIG